jgi:hypothetical protein
MQGAAVIAAAAPKTKKEVAWRYVLSCVLMPFKDPFVNYTNTKRPLVLFLGAT